MTLMIATDLDRTLIYSASALDLQMSDEHAPALVSVEILDGRPQSYTPLTAVRRLEMLSAVATLVPLTTRTIAQFDRVHFPGTVPKYAITSNGGHILLDGVSDPGWHASVVSSILRCDAGLAEVKAELRRRTHGSWALKRRVGDDLFCYLVADLATIPADFVPSWTDWCEARGWRVSVQGRKIYAIPEPLRKERAMLAVGERVGADRIIAAGDGALDAGFLKTADAGIRPAHGELAAMQWTHPTVSVTEHRGVLAANDITEWFSEQQAPRS